MQSPFKRLCGLLESSGFRDIELEEMEINVLEVADGTACWEADPPNMGTYVSEHSLDVDGPQLRAVEELLTQGTSA